MFEQSLYETEPVINTEPVATPLESGDLFHKYEIKNWEFTPRMYKILAAASVFNLLAVIFFAQTSLLTAKGCDTPFVGRVCEVLDTVYVGSMLFGTQREYVDAAYDKTDLGDADITFVDVSGETPPLSYPDGYFQIANPNEYQAMLDQANNPAPPIDMSGFPADITTVPLTGNSLIDTKPVIPKTNPNVIDGDLPTIDDRTGLADPPISRPKSPGMGRIRTPRTTPLTPKPTPDPKAQVADKKVDPPVKVDPTDPTDAVTINREPLKVFGKGVAEKLDKKEVDLSANFKVVAEAVLTADGKLDTSIDKKTKQKKSRILTAAGDPQMVTVVTEAIAAVGDSGWLGYLRTLGIEKINFTFTQTDDQLLITITSEQLTPERAKTLSSQLSGLLQAATLADKSGLKKLGDDEKALLQAAAATSSDKQVILNFALPKPVAQEMIQRNIQKARETETGVKPSGQLTGISHDERTANK